MAYSDADCTHCFSAIKRWDSIALHEFADLHPNFLNHFNCDLSGGVGGHEGLKPTSSSNADNSASASIKKNSKKSTMRTEQVEESQKKFLQELVSAITPVADPNLLLTQELLQVSSTLRELLAFDDTADEQLIAHFQQRKSELRYDV